MKSNLTVLLLILLFSFNNSSSGQILPIDSTTGKITYTEIVKVDSITKDQLYSRALVWFTKTFKSAKDAINLSDRETGVITSNSGLNFPAYYTKKNGKIVEDGIIKFTIKLYCKDGRFKYIITDLEHEWIDTNNSYACSAGALERKSTLCLWENLWLSLKEHADASINTFIKDLKMSVSEKNDW